MSDRKVLVLGSPGPLSQAIARRFTLEGELPVLAELPEGARAPGAVEVRTLVERCAGPVDILVLALDPAPPPEAPGEQALLEAVARHCWPLVEAFRQIREVFGAYPRQVLVLSPASDPRAGAPAEAARAVNEVLAPYLNHRFSSQDIIFNLLRIDFREDRCEAAARMVFAMTSGFMDAVRGQILHLEGAAARSWPGPVRHSPAQP